jgi:ribonucleoside-diphosphate reductase alpha chain
MDAFATSVSLALQHGVPLKVLCEKFAHTRFEPSGWTGNEQIGYAKSLMDYIFRWLSLRFLSGTQLTLFAGLTPQSPQLSAPPSILPEPEPEDEAGGSQIRLARLVEEVAKRLNQVSGSAGGHAGGGGIAPEVQPAKAPQQAVPAPAIPPIPKLEDRGIYHASDAMRGMYEMGDAPSCSTCGAIMVRNGSCYRCMSCGSTSGCS